MSKPFFGRRVTLGSTSTSCPGTKLASATELRDAKTMADSTMANRSPMHFLGPTMKGI